MDVNKPRRKRLSYPEQLERMMGEDRKRIVSYIRRKTRSHEEAEDVVQEAFLVAFQHINTFQGKAALRSWVTRIAINVFLMRLRKGDTTRLVYGQNMEWRPAHGDLEADTILKLDFEKMQRKIEELPPCYARPLTMRGQGMMYKEIAQVMGYSVGAAKSYVNRGKAKLLGEMQW